MSHQIITSKHPSLFNAIKDLPSKSLFDWNGEQYVNIRYPRRPHAKRNFISLPGSNVGRRKGWINQAKKIRARGWTISATTYLQNMNLEYVSTADLARWWNVSPRTMGKLRTELRKPAKPGMRARGTTPEDVGISQLYLEPDMRPYRTGEVEQQYIQLKPQEQVFISLRYRLLFNADLPWCQVKRQAPWLAPRLITAGQHNHNATWPEIREAEYVDAREKKWDA